MKQMSVVSCPLSVACGDSADAEPGAGLAPLLFTTDNEQRTMDKILAGPMETKVQYA